MRVPQFDQVLSLRKAISIGHVVFELFATKLHGVQNNAQHLMLLNSKI